MFNAGGRVGRKAGGRTKKMGGGPMMGGPMMGGDPRMGMVKDKAMEFSGQGTMVPGLKKGGKAKGHPDEAMDRALIKKMVKPEARKKKDIGGGLAFLSPLAMGLNALRGDDEKKNGGRAGRKAGGGVFSGAGYPEKIPGVVPGGRTARKEGGRTKGKMDVNIIIQTGKQPDGGMMPPGPPPMPPGPPPGPPPMPPGPPPMPPGPPPGMMPPGMMPPPEMMPPMPRKRGGRASYKDMTAGSGSGEGRLQKTEIEEHKRAGRKAGGGVYRSYKDMDAGSGSGMGRLEKTEIQSRKR
jgi:hypothetical protein